MLRIISAVVAVSLVALAACSNRRITHHPVDAVNGTTRVLMESPGDQGAPRYSPDGRRIAFVGAPPGSPARLYIMDVTGGALQLIDSAGTNVSGPSWSPDGNRIAFLRGGSIWIVRIAGGSAARITPPLLNASGTDWSAQRNEIVFGGSAQGGSEADIWVTTPQGQMRQVTNHADGEWFPRWSPDGRRIAFYSTWGMAMTDIYTIDASGGGLTQVTDHPGEDFRPAFSPDGQSIVFNSRRGGQNDLWRVPVTSGTADPLTNDAALEIAADWSPDGRTLIFEFDSTHAQLYRVDRDGSHRVQLTSGSFNHARPAVSPSGGWIAFESNERSSETSIVVSSDGRTVERLLVPSAAIQRDAAWSSDGTAIAFVSNPSGFLQGRNVWIASADGTSPRQLTTMGDAISPTWIAGDSAVAFVARTKVWMQSIAGGDPVVLIDRAEPAPTSYLPATREVIARSSGVSVAVSIDAPHTVRALPAFLAAATSVRFSNDGMHVAYIATPDGQPDIYVATAAGTEIVRLTHDKYRESTPAWTADGRAVVFSMQRARSQLGVRAGR
jgi:Tol biopolymer transport system component